ncbi:MAG TPA: sigma-70 family RNA polymerase sigma factor [Gemmataceae bacterium]|nr:sigma-70 family RNA polymerase sigma factor [Gemmataceae bacterium]
MFRGRLDYLMHRLRRAVGTPADAASDAALLGRFIVSRDQAAFELLLWRHGPMVLSVCRRMLRCDQDAEDAFQAAFLLLARKAASIRRRESVAGWLYQTACRVALRARVTARKQPATAPVGAEPTAPDAEPDFVWRELRPILDEEIRRLPEKYRLVIVLCWLQGRTHAEAARELGCPRGTIGVRLHRARDILRGRLTRRGLALSAGALALLAAERAAASAPAAIVHAALKAALLFAAGKAVGAAASPQAVAWTQGILRSLFMSKMKMLTAAILVLAALGSGVSYFASLKAAPPRQDALSAPPAAGKADDSKVSITVPAEEEGRLVLVGTGIQPNETVAAKDRVKVEVGFLAVEVDAKNDPKYASLAPEKWWATLDPTGAKAFVRWKPGDALPPDQLIVVREEREYRKLHVGDMIEEGQLLAIVDEDTALNDVAIRVQKLDTAESEYVEAGKTKQEAERRAKESQRLYELHTGVISLDAYYADLLNAARYAAEEHAKLSARQEAVSELRASLSILKMHEIRSLDRGIVKEILKRRGEDVRPGEAIVRLEVEDATAAGDRIVAPPAAPSTVVHVPAQRDGVLLIVGTEIKEGEKVPADRVVVAKIGGEEKRYRRLMEGDAVEEGQLLARLDDRLARLDVEEKKDRVEAAEADVRAALKTKEEAERRLQGLSELRKNNVVSDEEFNSARLSAERSAEEVKGKAAALKGAEAELQAAQTVLEMYEIRSPVRGVVKSIAKNRGEAVKALETVVEIEEQK